MKNTPDMGGINPANSDSDDDELEQLQYKVVILGDGAIGKTSLVMRFCEDQFARKYKQTIGVDFFIKHVVLPGDVHVALQIWDIGGQTIGSKMIHNYIFGAHAVLLVYDITNVQSFQSLEDWHSLVTKTYNEDMAPYIALIGNKTDLKHLRTVKQAQHNAFADKGAMYSYFVSAKTCDNVSSTFYRIAADLAGIILTKAEIESNAKVVHAEVINYPQHDPQQKEGSLAEKEKKCVIM